MNKLILLLSLLALGMTNVKGQSAGAIINGEISSLNDGDRAILTIKNFGSPLFMTDKIINCTILNHSFAFSIPATDHPLFIYLRFREKVNNFQHLNKLNALTLSNYLVESGDRVSLKEKDMYYTFEGKGSEKFNLIHSLETIFAKHSGGYSRDKPENLLITYKKWDTIFLEKMHLLEHKRKLISKPVFDLLKADCLGNLYFRNHHLITGGMTDTQKAIALKTVKYYRSIIPLKYLAVKSLEKDDVLKYSASYTYYGLDDKYRFDSCIMVRKDFNIRNYFDYIMSKYRGGLRERMLTNLLVYARDSTGNIRPLVDRALKVLREKAFKDVLYELVSNRLPGAAAMDFTLPDTAGKLHSFSDFKGKVVLMDFWFTGCGSCAAAKPFLEKIEMHFKGQPVVFLTINNDQDKKMWIRSVRSNVYTSPLSFNLFTEGMSFDHPLSKHYNIMGGPYFILVDKNGRVTENPENPSNDYGVQLTKLIASEVAR